MGMAAVITCPRAGVWCNTLDQQGHDMGMAAVITCPRAGVWCNTLDQQGHDRAWEVGMLVGGWLGVRVGGCVGVC